MDKISDIYKELKERLASPFFFSFIISWCIFNWKIIIGLFFDKVSDLRPEYKNYIDLVSKNSDGDKIFKYPFYAALAYTFLYPFFRNGIYIFQAWTKTWGDNWALEVSKTSNISISKYLELRDKYSKRTTSLEKILKDESKYVDENDSLRNQVLEAKSENNTLKDQLSKWQQANDYNFLTGEWEYVERKSDGDNIQKINIQGNRIDFYDEPNQNGNNIDNFFKDPNSNRISFRLTSRNGKPIQSEVHKYYSLEIFNDFRMLKGKLNDSIAVEFRRR